jgi:hypothetical protein
VSASFGDFLVFVDESGDHNLTQIDPQFPVFVLLFAIIPKEEYVTQVCPGLQRFKFEFGGMTKLCCMNMKSGSRLEISSFCYRGPCGSDF